jgi:hypothetical protein
MFTALAGACSGGGFARQSSFARCGPIFVFYAIWAAATTEGDGWVQSWNVVFRRWEFLSVVPGSLLVGGVFLIFYTPLFLEERNWGIFSWVRIASASSPLRGGGWGGVRFSLAAQGGQSPGENQDSLLAAEGCMEIGGYLRLPRELAAGRDRWSCTWLPADLPSPCTAGKSPIIGRRGGSATATPTLRGRRARRPRSGEARIGTVPALPTAKEQSFARSVLRETVGRWKVCWPLGDPGAGVHESRPRGTEEVFGCGFSVCESLAPKTTSVPFPGSNGALTRGWRLWAFSPLFGLLLLVARFGLCDATRSGGTDLGTDLEIRPTL